MTISENTPIREELADDGTSTGVEQEVIGDQIDSLFDPDRIKVRTKSMSVDLLLGRLQQEALNLQPDFQREAGIWSEEKQSRLIESLLLRIPLPSFYVSEDEQEVWEVIDGVQRLTTIRRFVQPSPGQGALKLRGLEYLGHEYQGIGFNDLENSYPRLALRIRETEFTFHIIESATPAPVRFNIFARINTGGMPLSNQELRHALVPGKARELLKQWASSDEFQCATARSVRPHRMADREMVLRYLAFYKVESPESYSRKDFGKFLMYAMEEINRWSDEDVQVSKQIFEEALRVSHKIFGDDAFRKMSYDGTSRSPINRALFECMAVNFANLSDLEKTKLVCRKERVRDQFKKLMTIDTDFLQAISVGTGDPKKVNTRFKKTREVLAEVVRA